MTLWCPDWPLVALEVDADEQAAVLVGDEVLACTATARADGVRRGLRRREAQRRCPALRLLDRDELQEARAYEPVLTALDAVSPSVEVVRPGLCVFTTKGPSRYFGGDVVLARLSADTVRDVIPATAFAGVADGRFAALLAARTADPEGTVIPPGGSAAFLAPLPVALLDRTGEPGLADLLVRLGLRTLGAVAALPSRNVASRFGAQGTLAHRLARGLDELPVTARVAPPDLTVQQELDPPEETLEPLAFVAKMLADTLQAELAVRGLGCTRVLVEAQTEHGEQRARLWRQDGALSAAAIAQRVRWQLAGWLNGAASERPTGGISLLRLTPDEVHRDNGRQLRLFGEATDADERAAVVLSRLQGLLGFDAVLVPVPAGGRDPADYTRLVPWGEPKPPTWTGEPPWPGRLPAPTPTVLYPETLPAVVVDARGEPVSLDAQGAVSAAPQGLSIRGGTRLRITSWAGPWPVNERWWDRSEAPAGDNQLARFQVVTDDGTARLLMTTATGWCVEGAYV
ncbi:MAG: protein ImuB [Frankiales bacterium]|nr:protein ImuB [Frankiales bacterium]